MKTYTICGSMRFQKEMMEIAYALESGKGWNILQPVYFHGAWSPTAQEQERLAKAHFRKIELSDGIYVVNPGGYIGEAVKREIAYAAEHGKEILYYTTEGLQ